MDEQRIDTERLRQLIDAHGAALRLYARQRCHAPDDALQEALIDLLRQDPVPDCPAAWLFKTIRRKAMNVARGERRRAEHHRRAGQHRQQWFLDDGGHDGYGEFDSDELAEMLDRLPQLEREIVVARIWGELSLKQIAELVDISSSSVHRRYRRALSLLGHMINGKLNETGQTDEPGTPISNRSDI